MESFRPGPNILFPYGSEVTTLGVYANSAPPYECTHREGSYYEPDMYVQTRAMSERGGARDIRSSAEISQKIWWERVSSETKLNGFGLPSSRATTATFPLARFHPWLFPCHGANVERNLSLAFVISEKKRVTYLV